MLSRDAPALAFAAGIAILGVGLIMSTSSSLTGWELNKEFWASIAGAVVGGCIALAVQMVGLRETRRAREIDRNQVRQALGTGLLLKMIRVYSNIHHIKMHFDEAFSSPRAKEIPEPWAFVLPLANPPLHVHFDPNELSVLLSLKDNAVFGSVVEMDNIHNGLVQLVTTMAEQRRALLEKLPAQGGIGPTFEAVLTEEQAAPLRPWVYQVNDLILQARERTNIDAARADAALDGLQRVLREKLGLPYTVQKIDGGAA